VSRSVSVSEASMMTVSSDEAVKAQFDTNVFAVLRLIRAFLPQLRAQGSGTIMNLSSIGGLRGYPSNGIYCSTKFAIEGITQALAAEIEPFGLSAVIVEPGYFRTAFLSGPSAGANVAPPMNVYNGTIAHEARDNFAKYNGQQRGNPEKGAARMWEYVADAGLLKGKPKLIRLPLGSDTGAALEATSASLAETAKEYEEVWKSTDFPDGE
jgi:NAD(P)-dependent dehydrogenase (short-subunit alcohol dehydrogenase family)